MKTLLTLLAALQSFAAGATVPTPQQFAWHQTLAAADNSAGGGPFYRLELPAAVYSGSRRRDLGDLRVFNAAGDALPYALLQQEAQPTATRTAETPVPLFPLPAKAAKENGLSLQLQQAPDGRISNLHLDQTANPGEAKSSYLLDTSQVSDPIGSIRLAWEKAGSAVLSVSVESSDDLQRWQRIASGIQLYELSIDSQQLQQNSVPLGGVRARYLRITLDAPSTPVEITHAFVTTALATPRGPELRWSTPIAATAEAQAGEYTFASQGLPLRRLRLHLPNANTLAPLRLFHRANPQAAWQEEVSTIAYRLLRDGQEVQSPELPIGNGHDGEWRIVLDPSRGGIGAGKLTVQIGWAPHTLVFLARPPLPYLLAYGNAAIAPASLDIASLVPGFTPSGLGALPKLGVAASAAANAAAAEPPPASAKNHWQLWALLILGVAVLAAMVWKLLAQLKNAPDKSGSP